MTVYTINEWRPKECSSYMIIKIIVEITLKRSNPRAYSSLSHDEISCHRGK